MGNRFLNKKILVIIDIIIFILSLIYMIVYKQSLEEISNLSYDITYKVIYASVVIPCLYFAAGGLLILIADKYILKPITKVPPMVFVLISVIGIIFYILMMILHYVCINGNMFFYFISDKTYIFIILGVLMSLGICNLDCSK